MKLDQYEKLLAFKREHKLQLVKNIRDMFQERLGHGNASGLRETAEFVDSMLVSILDRKEAEERRKALHTIAAELSTKDLIDILISRGCIASVRLNREI